MTKRQKAAHKRLCTALDRFRVLAQQEGFTAKELQAPDRSSDIVDVRRRIAGIMADEGYQLLAIAKAMHRDHSTIAYLLKDRRRPIRPWGWPFGAAQAITVLRDLCKGVRATLVARDLGWSSADVQSFAQSMESKIRKLRTMDAEEFERGLVILGDHFQKRIDGHKSNQEAE